MLIIIGGIILLYFLLLHSVPAGLFITIAALCLLAVIFLVLRDISSRRQRYTSEEQPK
jgi:hypothetical protein